MRYTYTTETGVELRRKVAKKKKGADEMPEPTPNKQWLVPSGWCADNMHDKCKHQFTYGKCGCDCGHGGKSES